MSILYPSGFRKSLICTILFSLKCGDIVIISCQDEFHPRFPKCVNLESIRKKKLFQTDFVLGPLPFEAGNHFSGRTKFELVFSVMTNLHFKWVELNFIKVPITYHRFLFLPSPFVTSVASQEESPSGCCLFLRQIEFYTTESLCLYLMIVHLASTSPLISSLLKPLEASSPL